MISAKIKNTYNTRFKVCSRCGYRKRIKSFDKQTRNGKTYYKPYCCGCKSKGYRKRNPQLIAAISNKGKRKYRQKQLSVKAAIMKAINQPTCKKCGFADVRALTFHHRIAEEKVFSLSYGFTHSYSFETLLEEAKKCNVLCMNCHTIQHCLLTPLEN